MKLYDLKQMNSHLFILYFRKYRSAGVFGGFVLLLLAVSCHTHRTSFPPGLAEAETWVNVHPDSALSVLRAMKMDGADVSEEARMLHRLLTIKAEDKLYVLHTSDSLILSVVRYYEKKGDKRHLAEAYFYLASTYRDRNDAPRALKVFHQAAVLCEQTGQNTLMGMVCGQMGNLFAYQQVYDEALNMYRKSRHYYRLSGDSLRCAGSLCDFARSYDGKQEKDSALYYYQEAIQMYDRLGDNKNVNSVSAELGCFYFDQEQHELAEMTLSAALKRGYRGNNVLLYMGLICHQKGKFDSARHYFKEVIKDGDFRKQCYTYYYLSKLEDEQGNRSLAAEYREQYRWRQDSIQAMTQSHTMEKLHLLYRFQREEQKNHDLALKSQAYLQYIWCLLFCVAVLVIIGILVSQNIRQRRREAKEQQERFLRIQKEKERQSLARMEANERKLQELENKLREANANNGTLQRQLLLAQKEMLELSNRQNQAFRDNRELLEEAFRKSDIYLFFHKASKDEASLKVTDAHWDELRQALDTTYSHFTDRLYELYPKLSQQELRICYLVKTGIPAKGISLLLSRTKTAITMSRCRLYKKIHGTEGSAEMMDAFIAEF